MRPDPIRHQKDARDAFTLWAQFVRNGAWQQSATCRCDESLERVTGQQVTLSQPERDADYLHREHELAAWVSVVVDQMRAPTAYIIRRHYLDRVELREIAAERISLALDAIATPNRCREVTGHLWKSVQRLHWLEQHGHELAADHRHKMQSTQTRSVQRIHQSACEYLIEARALYIQRLKRDAAQALDGGVLVNLVRRVMARPDPAPTGAAKRRAVV